MSPMPRAMEAPDVATEGGATTQQERHMPMPLVSGAKSTHHSPPSVERQGLVVLLPPKQKCGATSARETFGAGIGGESHELELRPRQVHRSSDWTTMRSRSRPRRTSVGSTGLVARRDPFQDRPVRVAATPSHHALCLSHPTAPKARAADRSIIFEELANSARPDPATPRSGRPPCAAHQGRRRRPPGPSPKGTDPNLRDFPPI